MEYSKFLAALKDKGFTEEDAKQGGVAFLGSLRDLKAGAEHLKDDEEPMAIAAGQYFELGGTRAGVDNAIFILTNKRLVKANKKIKNTDFTTFYIRNINSSEYKTSFLSSILRISTTSGIMTLEKVKKDTAQKFNAVMLELIEAEHEKQDGAKGGVTAASGMEEVKKAKALLDDGIITQAEFDKIKKKHIG